MTSKNLYFKLMKEDLKSRLWTVSLIALGFFFSYPVAAAFMAGEIKDYRIYEQGLAWYSERMLQWLSFENGMTMFLMIVTALICGLSGFSYLNSKSKVDFYHSLPVKREKLYIANYMNGILMLAVPYAVSMVLAVLVGISNGIEGSLLWHAAGAAYWLHMTYFVLMYTTVVVAVMMTGNLVVAFLGSLVFSFFAPVALSLAQGYFGTFFHTYVWESGEKLAENFLRISPVTEYFYQVSQYIDGETVWAPALVSLAVTAALAVLGCFLYRKRPSEAAGKAMAFAVSKPIIRILLTLVCAMGLGAFFWSMRESTGWAVFGVLCGAVLSHCVIEIIYHFDFKKLFDNKAQLIGCILVSLAVLFVFRYDLAGYDRYLPKAGDVKGAAVEVTRLNGWVSYGSTRRLADGSYGWKDENSLDYAVEHMNYTDTENLLAIAAAGIDETARNGGGKNQYPESALPAETIDPEQTGASAQINICYTLKSGRKVYRRYNVNLDKIMPRLELLCSSEEYQKGAYPVMGMEAENVAEIYYLGPSEEIRLDRLTAEQKAVILETYQKEFAAMTPSQMETENPLGLIRFSTEEEDAGLRWLEKEEAEKFASYPEYRYSAGNLSNRSYYPIYASCKETMKLLKEQQVEVEESYRDMDIQAVSIQWYRRTDGEPDGSMAVTVVTDPGEIAQLKEIMTRPGLRYYNQMFKESDVIVDFTVIEDGGGWTYDSCFPRGKVPQFIKERLMADKAE